MVDIFEDQKICELSNDLKSQIMTFMIQSTSASYSFARYDKIKERHFFVVDKKILKDVGQALPEEEGQNINESIFIDDLVSLAERFGIDLEVSKTEATFIVKELDYIASFQESQLLQSEKNELEQKTTNPWWLFWK